MRTSEEFDEAIRQLRELYEATDDVKERLGIRRELNKMYRHYDAMAAIEAAADPGESETLAEIRSHLEPLGLAAEGTPLMELVRLAALKLTEK